MKIFTLSLVLLCFCCTVHSQWKVRQVENFDGSYTEMYVLSNSGNEVLSLEIYDKRARDLYVTSANSLGLPSRVYFKFNNNPDIYNIGLSWPSNEDSQPNHHVYRIDGIHLFSFGGPDGKGSKPLNPGDKINLLFLNDFIHLFETHQKLFCRITYGKETPGKYFDMEFSLQNFQKAYSSIH